MTTGYHTGTHLETNESTRAELAHVWELSSVSSGGIVGFRQYTGTLAFERALLDTISGGRAVAEGAALV